MALVHLVMVGPDPVARLSPVIRNEPVDCLESSVVTPILGCDGQIPLVSVNWGPSARRSRLGALDVLDPSTIACMYVLMAGFCVSLPPYIGNILAIYWDIYNLTHWVRSQRTTHDG